jgi:hypothetical protein
MHRTVKKCAFTFLPRLMCIDDFQQSDECVLFASRCVPAWHSNSIFAQMNENYQRWRDTMSELDESGRPHAKLYARISEAVPSSPQSHLRSKLLKCFPYAAVGLAQIGLACASFSNCSPIVSSLTFFGYGATGGAWFPDSAKLRRDAF